MGYQIFTDATADFNEEMLWGLPNLEVIPMEVLVAGGVYTYGPKGNLTVRQFYNMQKEERKRKRAIEKTIVWLQRFGQKKITAKQLTRDVLGELIDKIYVFPEQEIDIHFKFVNPLLEAEEEAK